MPATGKWAAAIAAGWLRTRESALAKAPHERTRTTRRAEHTRRAARARMHLRTAGGKLPGADGGAIRLEGMAMPSTVWLAR